MPHIVTALNFQLRSDKIDLLMQFLKTRMPAMLEEEDFYGIENDGRAYQIVVFFQRPIEPSWFEVELDYAAEQVGINRKDYKLQTY